MLAIFDNHNSSRRAQARETGDLASVVQHKRCLPAPFNTCPKATFVSAALFISHQKIYSLFFAHFSRTHIHHSRNLSSASWLHTFAPCFKGHHSVRTPYTNVIQHPVGQPNSIFILYAF